MSVEKIRELALAAEKAYTEAVRQSKIEGSDEDNDSISSVLDSIGETSFDQYLCTRQVEFNQIESPLSEKPDGEYFDSSESITDDDVVEYIVEEPEEEEDLAIESEQAVHQLAELVAKDARQDDDKSKNNIYRNSSVKESNSDDEVFEYVVEEPQDFNNCKEPEHDAHHQHELAELVKSSGSEHEEDEKAKIEGNSSANLIQLNYIVEELISTEINYLNSLYFLLQKFLKPIRNILAKKSELKIAQKVCNYSKMLHRLGTNFLDDLAQAQSDVESIGDVFLQYKTLFNLYAKLSKVWNTYMKLVREPAIEQVIRKLEVELNEAIGFSRYMLKPIQRLTKYELLLNQMLKKMAGVDVDTTSIKSASEFMKGILNRCNTIIALESIEYNKYDETESGNYVMKTDLKWRVVKKKKKKVAVQVELFLFEKVVILAVDVEGTLQYRDSILLSKLTRVDKVNTSRFTLEEVQATSKRPRAIKLEAVNEQAKQKCLKSIDNLLWGELEYLKKQQAKNYDKQGANSEQYRTKYYYMTFFS